MTGATAPGMLADAIMMFLNSCRAAGEAMDAMAPIFQVTARPASRSVVPISRTRPFANSRAIAAMTSGVRYFATSRASGLLSAMPSLARPASLLRARKTSSGPIEVATLRITSSYCEPRNANGAIRAPALMPVTTLNWGRSPWALQPARSPAANAPASPPPEMPSK